MCNAQEKGFVERILRRRQIKKPACQSLYTVYPVSLAGVLPAFVTLICKHVKSYSLKNIILYVFKLFHYSRRWDPVFPAAFGYGEIVCVSWLGKIMALLNLTTFICILQYCRKILKKYSIIIWQCCFIPRIPIISIIRKINKMLTPNATLRKFFDFLSRCICGSFFPLILLPKQGKFLGLFRLKYRLSELKRINTKRK